MNFLKRHDTFIYLSGLIVIAAVLRIIFYSGHIFSDDAYYDFLSYTFYKGNFAQSYIGYPHYPLRINLYILTALMFKLFGTNEWATTVMPMIYSLASIVLAYFCAETFSKSKQIARICAFLIAFLPTEIVFASINFSDAPSTLFINAGIFLLYLAWKNKNYRLSILSGICFVLSFHFKMNIFFIVLLLLALFIFDRIKNRNTNYHILIVLFAVALCFFTEACIYFVVKGDFFYRLTLIEQNSLYGKHEFFTLGSVLGYADESRFWPELVKLIFIKNMKYLFLRRFYLFIPLVALVQSIISIRKRQNHLLIFWFLGLALLFVAFTVSLQRYQPMVLRLSWYLFPIFLPAGILSACFINSMHKYFRYVLILLYIYGSIIMCQQYWVFFNHRHNDEFKNFLKTHTGQTIYSDHYTKYSIDLIDGYRQPLRTARISGEDFNLLAIPGNSLVVYVPNHISELEKQGHQYPAFDVLISNNFRLIFQSGIFNIYERIKKNNLNSADP